MVLMKKSDMPWIGKRHIQFVLIFFAINISNGMRTILSVAIIAMREKRPPNPTIPTYPQWTNPDTILSSFFWGYLVTLIIAGQLGERYGPKWFLVITMAFSSSANICLPFMASKLGANGVILCQIVFGLSQGFIYPSSHNLLSKWTPLSERSKATNFVYSGASLGIVISMPITGNLAASYGWPLVFYGYGMIGVLWSVMWAIYGSNSPEEHTTITDQEKFFIEQNSKGCSYNVENPKIPWKQIVTSLPVWAILVTSAGQSWGGYTLMTEMPSYLSAIMKCDIRNNSFLSALPYVASWVMYMICGPLADRLITSDILNIGQVRKIFNSIGCFLPALALIGLSFLDHQQKDLAVGLLILAVGAQAVQSCGGFVNHIDLAPNYAGTLFSITNGTSVICSILSPLAVQFFQDEKEDPILWCKVFGLSSGIFIITGIFYAAFASGDLQSWNEVEEKEKSASKEQEIRDKV